MSLGFMAAGLWLRFGQMQGYAISSVVDPSAMADPLGKVVVRTTAAWAANFVAYPILWLLPALGLLGANLASGLLILRRTGTAFVLSSLSIVGVVGTAGAAMFPFIMPSSSMPNASLTVWDSVSSQMTLNLMFWATVIFMPLIVLYTSWAYRVMRGKVTVDFIRSNEHSAY